MGEICADGREAEPNKEGQREEVEDADRKNPRKAQTDAENGEK